jgi:5-oxopent-3-ene-1,2,5-tricarboxylate decarboxylase/2-hydroxyhepta-2,4-diene-1,7-dioate isomerase
VPADPAIFFKPATALVGHRGAVIYPAGVEYMHYENELAVVIGRRCRRVRAEHALEMVAGYTIANDITVRDFVRNIFRPPVKGKGWDTFLPIGPYLVEDEIADPHGLELRTYVNGELRQRGNTADQVTRVPQLIAYLTEFMTLEPGDILLTGTPKGLSHIHAGDEMRLEIDGLGALESKVIAEADRPDQEASWAE